MVADFPSSESFTCSLCEANCGVRVEVDGTHVGRISGDRRDPVSQGYVCPKVVALREVHVDPDRLTRAQLRDAEGHHAVDWALALAEVATRLAQVREQWGPDSIAVVFGNPLPNNYAALFFSRLLLASLATLNVYSVASLDGLPHMLTAQLMFGHRLLQPVPDIDRTSFLLMIGANPNVSNGSAVSAPAMAKRIAAIQKRGGKVVVVDPRKTETAASADRHHFIRPGRDAVLLLSLINVLRNEQLVASDRLMGLLDSIPMIDQVTQAYTPARAARETGLTAIEICTLAREFAAAPAAVCYGRIGACVQEFGSLTCWLINVLNALTGNLDRAGGAMFAHPPVDLVQLDRIAGGPSTYGTFHAADGAPEFCGELPLASLAGAIETPGPRQVKALITFASNLALSAPNSRRLARALPQLEYMVSIDCYLNETTRHAHAILPPTSQLQRDHSNVFFGAMAARNYAKYSQAVLARSPHEKHDWEILLSLACLLSARRSWLQRLVSPIMHRLLHGIGPRRLFGWALLLGPYGLRRWHRRVSLRTLLRTPEGLDFGPLEPCLKQRIRTLSRRVDLAPAALVADLRRLEAALIRPTNPSFPLLLIGRRQRRTLNSWLHNCPSLAKGKSGFTLWMHPADAAVRNLDDNDSARLVSGVGELTVPVHVTDRIFQGVVSLPHGWRGREMGIRLSVAQQRLGANVNDVTDERFLDMSGTAALNGLAVDVQAASPAG